jgi:hypothetical protein
MVANKDNGVPYFDISSDPATAGIRWKKRLRTFQIFIVGEAGATPVRKRGLRLRMAGSEVQDVYFPYVGDLDINLDVTYAARRALRDAVQNQQDGQPPTAPPLPQDVF